MNVAILQPTSPTEVVIICADRDAGGVGVEKGRFTVEINDSTAILVISRLWLAGVAPEQIATAMKIGLLPPKNK